MSLRIISGERRGAKLLAPEGLETRPLRDRIRQALFNILRPELRDSVVIDAFAGTGAVGLEALSNGAAQCVFIEPARPAIDVLRKNIAKLRYEDRAIVLEGKSPQVCSRIPSSLPPFNLLLLMPPYHSGLCHQVLESPALASRLSKDAQAVCEIHEDEVMEPTPGWAMIDDRRYGITRLIFLKREA